MATRTTSRTRTRSDSTKDPPPSETGIPLDVVFGILSNERRRMALRYMCDESRPERTTLGHLAEYIAGIENDKPEEELSSSERKRVYIVLYQCHLPRMDDAGVIDFDEHRKTVELAENAEDVLEFLPTEAGDGSSEGRRGVLGAVGSIGRALNERILKVP